MRFLRNIRVPKEERVMTSELNVDEIREAEFRWIKENQTTIDQEDRQQLEKCLNVTLDTKGLLRTNDRIKNADIPYETRSPIVINRKHKLAELITIDCHRLVQHLGARQTLAEIRNRFWITRGRSFVRGVLAKCSCPCKKFNPRHYRYPEEADLPKLRLRDDVPFSGTGVDYFGPILVKNVYIEDELEDELYKAHTALYTCATTRGVVLDLVQDATASAFVSSLIRFIARRGCPYEVKSDNGTMFIAQEVQSFATSRNIDWSFNIAEAPWHGGMFERLVQTVKRCLKKTIGNACLSFTEFQTVLAETENIVNSRPLNELDDDDLEEPLTPNHLLFGRKLSLRNTNENVVNLNDGIELSKRHKYLQTVIDHFWNRWRKEYLNTLRQYTILNRPRGQLIRVNDVVLIYDDKQPRHNWRIGRVQELIGTRGAKIFADMIQQNSRIIY